MDVPEAHPASSVLPSMEGEDLVALAEDIRERGLMEPIVLYEGQVLDGRARLRACLATGIEPRYTDADLNGKTAVEFVVEKNLPQRHMSPPQRAALALELMPRIEAEAKDRQRMSGKLYGTGKKSKAEVSLPDDKRGKTATRVGKLVGLGTTTIEKTIAIQKRSPRTIRRMQEGRFRTMAEANLDAGFEPRAHDAIVRGQLAPAYGKGDKWREASEPILRYLKAWEDRGFEFKHVSPKEAGKRIKMLDKMIEQLESVRADLRERSHKATLSAPLSDKRKRQGGK